MSHSTPPPLSLLPSHQPFSLPSLSCPSLHLPCVPRPAAPAGDSGIPALMQAALGSAAETVRQTQSTGLDCASLGGLLPVQDAKFFILPSCLPDPCFNGPEDSLARTGLHFNFLLILNFKWYKLFSAIKAPKFQAIIGIFKSTWIPPSLLLLLFFKATENRIIRANPQLCALYLKKKEEEEEGGRGVGRISRRCRLCHFGS